MNATLEERLTAIQARLTPAYVQAEVEALLRQGQDVGGGVNAARLIRHWIGEQASDVLLSRAYARLKPALAQALEALPSLVFFEGD